MRYCCLTFLLLCCSYISHSQRNLGFGQLKEIKNVLKGSIFPFELPNSYGPKTTGFFKMGYTTKNVPFNTIYTRYLNILNQDNTTNFEGIPIEYALETTNFCILYEGNFCVDNDDTYTIKIASDDGIILWIDGKEAINKDKFSQMSYSDTIKINLTKGSHPIKIWYFQGFAPSMGLEVHMKKTSEKSFRLLDFFCIPTIKEEKITIGNQILFDTGKAILKPESIEEIKALSLKIKSENYNTVIIDGYTDNRGSNDLNDKLSLNRANSIMIELKKHLEDKSIEFLCFGHGSSNPISDNSTPAGQNLNRRVEIKLIKKQ
jgi:outer membrane protein OmpA-like peptidoglycan-associated protein